MRDWRDWLPDIGDIHIAAGAIFITGFSCGIWFTNLFY